MKMEGYSDIAVSQTIPKMPANHQKLGRDRDDPSVQVSERPWP